MIDLLIKNGKIVSPDRTVKTCVAVKGEKIVGVGDESLFPEAEKVIDAGGKYVLPGLIDSHVHFELPFQGTVTRDDYKNGSICAALSGITTFIDFAIQQKGDTPVNAIMAERKSADPVVAVDYSLHAALTEANEVTIGQIKELVQSGIASFKLFMVYRKEQMMVDDGILFTVMEEMKKHNGLPGFHAENVGIIEYLIEKYVREGKRSAVYHGKSRPAIAELEAMQRAMLFAKHVDTPIYIFHMSIADGALLVKRAREQGQTVYAETCPHYLTLTDDVFEREDGINFIGSPPIRAQRDVDALWKGLKDGYIATISTDHCGFDSEQKKMSDGNFDGVPNGMATVELSLPTIFSEGVNKDRISVNRLVEVMSTEQAKIFGMYPQKGIIAPGSDADLVIVDPDLEKTVKADQLHMNVDYSVYEDRVLKGWPVMTFCRGKMVAENGEFTGESGYGRFIERKR